MPYADNELFYRRVPNNTVSLTPDDNLGGVRSNSGAWEDSRDNLTSVFAHSTLEEAGLEPSSVLRSRPGFHVAAITAGELRDLGLDVRSEPTDDGPEGIAHAVITGLADGSAGRKTRSKIAKSARFVDGHGPQDGLFLQVD